MADFNKLYLKLNLTNTNKTDTKIRFMDELTDEERTRRFGFFNKDNLDIETPKLDIEFWQLSKKSDVYGKGSGDSRNCHMCRRCGAIVGDLTTHSRWHSEVEKIELENIHVSATYL